MGCLRWYFGLAYGKNSQHDFQLYASRKIFQILIYWIAGIPQPKTLLKFDLLMDTAYKISMSWNFSILTLTLYFALLEIVWSLRW